MYQMLQSGPDTATLLSDTHIEHISTHTYTHK